jgi:hypothetical protein
MKVAGTIQIMYKARMSRAVYCIVNYSVKPGGDKWSSLSPCQLYDKRRKLCCRPESTDAMKPQDAEEDTEYIKKFHEVPSINEALR